MKKSLLALAAMGAFAGAAQAQSSVTVYGILDMGVGGGNSRQANGTTVSNQTALGVQQSAQSTSRLGFRGTEDLGGGMRAFFTFETTIRPNNTTATAADGDVLSTFNNRQAFVGIAQKGIGQIALGTQQTIIHNVVGRTTAGQQNNLVGDVIYSLGGTTGGLTAFAAPYGMTTGQSYAVRVNNAITLATETVAGFQGNAMFVLSNNDTTQTASNTGGQSNTYGYGLGVNYTWKKLFLTANYQSFTNNLNTATPGTSPTAAPGTFTQFSPAGAATRGSNVNDNTTYLAGSYDFGILQAFIGYINRKVNAENNNLYFNRYTAQQIGVRSNITPTVNVFASVGNGSWENTGYDMQSANINGYQLGSNYMLSKRTNLYAIFGNASQSNARNSTTNPATAAMTSYNVNNYAVGVRHTF